jgi:hypothetical protein
MPLIQGMNGRVYDSVTRQRVLYPVSHVEDRSPEEIRAKRIAEQSRPQPSGVPEPGTPFAEQRIAALIDRHGRYWVEKTDEGKRAVHQILTQDAERKAKADADKAQADFQASIKELTDFAQRDYESVMNDETATVADTEDAAARLAVAKQGDREHYKQLHAQYRDRVLQRVAERAAAVEGERATLAQKRDSILAEQLDAPPANVPEVKIPEPGPRVVRDPDEIAHINQQLADSRKMHEEWRANQQTEAVYGRL